MLSGFDVKEHGLYWNSWKPERGYIQVPTIFDAAEKNGGTAAAFVGKKKLEHIAHPGSVDHFSRPGYFCKKVVEEATDYLVEKRPQIEFIHFSDPDDLGHSRRLDVQPAARGRPPHRPVPAHAARRDGRRRGSTRTPSSSSRPITAATAITTTARSRRTA